MLNEKLKNELRNQQILPILNTTTLENDYSRLTKYLNINQKIKYVEITLREVNSFEIAIELKEKFPNHRFGLGSIIKKEEFDKGLDNNFSFFISPGIINEILEKKSTNYIPGAETISEFIFLNNLGYNTIKFFPANLIGEEKKLLSIKNILNDIYFIPTGGISLNNYMKYLELENVLCVGMSNFDKV